MFRFGSHEFSSLGCILMSVIGLGCIGRKAAVTSPNVSEKA